MLFRIFPFSVDFTADASIQPEIDKAHGRRRWSCFTGQIKSETTGPLLDLLTLEMWSCGLRREFPERLQMRDRHGLRTGGASVQKLFLPPRASAERAEMAVMRLVSGISNSNFNLFLTCYCYECYTGHPCVFGHKRKDREVF